MVLESGDADFRPLQIGQHANLPTGFFAQLPYCLCSLDMRFRIAMGKIQPHHVDARTEKLFQDAGRIGCRTQCSQNLGSS